MAVMWWMWQILLARLLQCYEEICRDTKCYAEMSTTYGDLRAYKVIDGNVNQDYISCSQTAPGQLSAFVKVDLGRVYELKNIVIYYRNESSWKPYRFRNFELAVTEGGNTSQWITCHRDTTEFPAVPSSIQNITCKKSARYVRVATKYDATEDNYVGIAGAILEVCEIIVYGCNVGFYGSSCSSCGGCQNCDIENGCHCSPYNYGELCEYKCSIGCLNGTCFPNGSCIGGCKDDYIDEKCTVNQQSSEKNSNSNLTTSALYVVTTVLFISISLNTFLIVRQTIYKRQKKERKEQDPTQDPNTPNTTTYDRVENNTGYQELGQLSQPSHYDLLK